MYPSATEMDLSLAYPLFFASQGRGHLGGEAYTVAAKVYLSGLGADEYVYVLRVLTQTTGGVLAPPEGVRAGRVGRPRRRGATLRRRERADARSSWTSTGCRSATSRAMTACCRRMRAMRGIRFSI